MEEKTQVTKMTKEAFLADYPDIAEEIRSDAKADYDADNKAADEVNALESKVDDLEKKLEEATKANADLTLKVDDYEVKEKAQAKKVQVKQAIEDSKLDPAFVSEVFIDDLMKLEDEEQIQDRIKDRLELVESATGEVSGNGARATEDSTEKTEQDVEVTEEEAEESTPSFDTDALVKSMKDYRQFI